MSPGRLKVDCPSLDELLGGGLEAGAITLVYGEAGTGKTNLCLQAARNAVLAEKGKVVYVDTEGVSLERLEQIAQKNTPRVLKGILFYSPKSLAEQERMVEGLAKIQSASMVIVDSLNMYYRLQLKSGADEASRVITQMLSTLLRISREQEIPVLVTGQVYSEEENVRPFGGRIMEHIVKTIIRFDRDGVAGARRATLVKHRSRPEGATAPFRLTDAGLAA